MFYLQILVNGVLLGGIYALVASGMWLVWGTMRIVNVAHGAFIMVGAYMTYVLSCYLGLDPFISILPVMLALFVFGFLLQKYLINLIVRAPIFATLLLTFGLKILLTNSAQAIFTANFYRVNPSYGGTSFALAGIVVPWVRLGAFFIAVVLLVLLFVLLKLTKVGRAIRATSQDLIAARLAGVRVDIIYALTFGIGAALAGAAGSVWSVLFGVNPAIDMPLVMKSFVVAILGGLISPFGPIIGGVILGLTEVFSSACLGDTWKDVVAFTLLVIVLVVRPHGIFSSKEESQSE